MSLEDEMKALRVAVEANTAALGKILGAAAAKATAPAAAADKKDAAPAKADKADKTKKTKAPTEDEVRAAFGDWLKVKDQAEREKRKAMVPKIAEHLGVEKVTEGDDEARTKAMAILKDLMAGNVPDFLIEADEEEEEDGDGLL
jgi:hypothetical protein